MRKRGDRNRPHICVHESSGLSGDIGTYRFSSHDMLAYHLIREHLLRESWVNKCYADCSMVDPNPLPLSSSEAINAGGESLATT